MLGGCVGGTIIVGGTSLWSDNHCEVRLPPQFLTPPTQLIRAVSFANTVQLLCIPSMPLWVQGHTLRGVPSVPDGLGIARVPLYNLLNILAS